MKLDIRQFDRVSSTQDVCRALAADGAAEGLTVVADEQTAGRGRVGHTWFSPPGQALYFSMLLRPTWPLAQVNWITMIAALAVIDAIAIVGAGLTSTAGARAASTAIPTIKWFNDVMLADKKLCGILVETSISAERLDYAILGIGLNVNTDFSSAPEPIRTRATSLHEYWGTNREIDRHTVLQATLAQVTRRYHDLDRDRQSPAPDYAKHLDTLGKWVRIQAGDQVIAGLAEQVDISGGLCLQTAQGLQTIHFGHVLSAMSVG